MEPDLARCGSEVVMVAPPGSTAVVLRSVRGVVGDGLPSR